MPQLNVSFTETIGVPEGTQIVLAPTGVVAGLRLPDGSFLKPFMSYELYAPGNEDGDPEGDADHDELLELGVETDISFERTADVIDGQIEIDNSKLDPEIAGA